MKTFEELYPTSKKFRLADTKTVYKNEVIYDRYGQPREVSNEKVSKGVFVPTSKYKEYLKEKQFIKIKDEIKLLKYRLSIEYNDIDFNRLVYLIQQCY